MADERKNPRKWSLEEIDELLQDSGMLPRDDNSEEAVEDAAGKDPCHVLRSFFA